MRSWVLLLVAAAVPFRALAAPPQPLRMAGTAFDEAATVEIRDLSSEEADAAIRSAFAELDRARDEARALERAAESGRPVAIDGQAIELLRRAQAFCLWSEGAVGPLGGQIFDLWGLRTPKSALPTPDALARAVASAGCDRMAIDAKAGTVTVADAIAQAGGVEKRARLDQVMVIRRPGEVAR